MTWPLTWLHALIFSYCTCVLLHLLCFTVVQFWRNGFHSVLDRYMEARELLWQDWEEQAERNAHPVLTWWATASLLPFSLCIECLPNWLDQQISKCNIKKVSTDKLLNGKWFHGCRSNFVNWALKILGFCILTPFVWVALFRGWLCNKEYLFKVKNVSSFWNDNLGVHLSTNNIWISLGKIMVNLFHKIAALQSYLPDPFCISVLPKSFFFP